jgi:hypothetical protein
MEDQIQLFLQGMIAKSPIVGAILMAIGTLVVGITIVVALSKTTTDDEKLAAIMAHPFLGPILKVIMAFSLIQPKLPAPKTE